MFDPYLKGEGRLADTIRGMGSGEETLRNLHKYNSPERKLDLLTKKENQIDSMRENQPGYFDSLIEKQFGLEGTTDPYKLNIGSEYDRLMDRITSATEETTAEQLTTDSRTEVLGKSAIMGVADATAFIVSMLDGPGGPLQYEKMVNAVHNNKYINLKNSINKENLASRLGKTVDQLTEDDLKDAEDMVYNLHRMSHLGFGLGTIAAFPAEDILIRGVFQGLTKGGKFAARKSQDLASDIKYGDVNLSATRGVLEEPKGGVGAQVVEDVTNTAERGGRGTPKNYKAMVAQNIAEGQSNYNNVLNLLNEGIYTQKEIMKILGVSRGTISQVIKKSGFKDLTFAQKADKLIDFNKSFDDNLNFALETLKGQSAFGAVNKVGDKIKFNPQGQGIAGYKEIKENLVKRYVDEYQLSVKEYETYIKDILATYGKTDLPPEFFVNMGRGKVTSAQIPNYKQALTNVRNEMDKVKPIFKNKWDYAFHQRNYANSLPPEEAAVYLKKIRENNRKAFLKMDKKREKNLADDPMNLSASEQTTFDQVNELWKTSASTLLKQDEAAQQALFKNTDLLIKIGWRTDGGGNLSHAFLDEAGEIVPKRLEAFKKSLLQNEFDPKKSRGFFQNDHIKEVSKGEPGQAGLSLLSNLQLLPSTLNQLFKAPAQTFIKDFLKRNPVSDNKKYVNNTKETASAIQKIIDKAEEIGVTLHISDVKKARDLGLMVETKNVGAPITTFGTQAKSKISEYVPTFDFRKLSFEMATGGRVGFSEGGTTDFDKKIKEYQEEMGMELSDAVYEAVKDFIGDRDKFADPAGLVGDPATKRDRDILNSSLFGEYLQADYDKRQEQKKFDALPESMKKPMMVFLEDEKLYDRVREADPGVRYKTEKKDTSISEIRARIAEEMIDKKPTKFPLSSFPKLLTENPLTKSMQRQFNLPFLILGDVANNIQNQMGGDEKTFAERYPVLAENLAKGFTPVEGTDPEAKYIDGIDEINRALETGVRNLGFNTMDLVLGGIDLTGFGDGKLSERLRENYEKTAKNDPETFMGDLLALLVEFGVPGGLVTKLVTRMQKALRIKGFNTMTRYIDDDITGGARFAMNASNIAKRMGTGAVIFGAADAIGGGPYNSLTRMLPDDATLLPGKPIDTTNLSGKELALANLKNRIRFGADGAMIGGLFPLLGPPAWALTKGTAALPFKTIPGINRSLFGGALQLAGVPLKIAADSLAGKIPYTNKTIPLVGEGISYLGKQGASLAQKTAAFMGKQVFTRAALGAYDAAYAKASIYTGVKPNTTMFSKNLPDFQDWRKFSVNSKDPLHQYLAKIDNKLAMFRDIGKMGKDAFGVKTQSDLYIRAKSRAVEKYLIDIERIAHKLAKGFEERHQKYGEFETIQKKYLDDVLGFLEGKIKIADLPKQLQVPANDLRNYTNGLKKEFGELLPTTDPIKYLIDSDINSMMRRSFAAFTNNSYAPTPQSVNGAKTFIKDLILGNNGLRMEAEMAFPNKSIADAIDEFASLKVADIMHTAKYEMSEPFKALETITRKLGLDDLVLRTGEELPLAIRKLLGEEKNLRSSLLQTTGNIIASTSQKKALDQIADMGLSNGWLFRTQDEALGKGILNAASLSDVKGSGFLLNDAIGLYGTPELIKQLGGYSLFDGFLKSTVYQNILAMKAMVQGGKTLYSPATQMRNVGSAALFALNVGHIGGSASVPQAFKIVMDDIFGPGRNVDKKKLNKFIERKIELGVIDENVVSQELTAILNDLKGATKETGEPVISNLNQLIQRVGNAQLSQYVQRLYAGGDNLWKLYGHEFYISELKQFTKSIDDVKRYFDDIIGREFVELSPKTGVKKTVMEGIEEIAAHLVRDTYPTYSRVPPAVQAIRKLPLGNFISFPAEMLRTTATTLSTSLKHIASGNPGLQSMGYRSLFGQFTTLYGVNEGVKALGHSMTDVSPEAMRAYQEGLGPSFMENHLMVPLTNRDPMTGEFKAFDLSSYNPYAYVIDPVESFIRELGTTRMSVDQVEGEIYNRLFDAASPLMAFIEPFTSETILLEPMFDIWARGGKARSGKTIYSPTDDFGDKVSKSFQHILETVAPGFVRSTAQVLNALSLDTKQGRLSDLSDVLLRLIGGSIINVDPVSALDYKAIDIRDIRSNAYKTEHFFSKENALERGPLVMAAEFRDIQQEALNAQFEVYKMFVEAMNTGLLTKKQIKDILGPRGRNVPNIDNLLKGKFTPVSYSKNALKLRANELYEEYFKNGITINKNDLKPFTELNEIIREMKQIKFDDLLDENRRPFTPNQNLPTNKDLQGLEGLTGEAEPVTPELPNMPTPIVPNNNMNPTNPATGLTTTETALLSPGEQAIRQRQKGMA